MICFPPEATLLCTQAWSHHAPHTHTHTRFVPGNVRRHAHCTHGHCQRSEGLRHPTQAPSRLALARAAFNEACHVPLPLQLLVLSLEVLQEARDILSLVAAAAHGSGWYDHLSIDTHDCMPALRRSGVSTASLPRPLGCLSSDLQQNHTGMREGLTRRSTHNTAAGV